MAASMSRLRPDHRRHPRPPLAFTILALAFLLEAFARRAFNSSAAGLYAGLITLSSFGIFIFSRINIPDILVCVLLTAALYLYYLSDRVPHPHDGLTVVRVGLERSSTAPAQSQLTPTPTPTLLLSTLFAASLALSVLTKGLIGIVFPLTIVLAHLLLTRGPRETLARLRRLHPALSALTFLAIAAPWHILIALANPAHGHPLGLTHAGGHWHLPYPTDGNVHSWAWFYFLNEQLYRYLNLRIPHDYDTSPLWLFLGLIFIWLMPWSAYLPPALLQAARSLQNRVQNQAPHPLQSHRKGWGALSSLATNLRTLPPPASLNLLLLLWATIPLLFFTFSTRQEYYVLPALPPMILLIANHLGAPHLASEMWDVPTQIPVPHSPRLHRDGWLPAAALLLLGTILSLTILLFLLRTPAPSPDTDLATLLHQNPADYALSFGHFLDLTGPALALFRLPLALTAAAFFLGPLAHFILRRTGKTHAATLSLAAAAFLFLLASWLGLRTFSPTLTSAQLAQAIAPQLHPQDLLAIHGEYESASTLGFYLRRNDLHIIEGRSSNLWYGSYFPDAPRIFETPQSIAARWPGPQRIFLWQDPHDPDRPPLTLPTPVYVLATSGGKQILSNQPNH